MYFILTKNRRKTYFFYKPTKLISSHNFTNNIKFPGA